MLHLLVPSPHFFSPPSWPCVGVGRGMVGREGVTLLTGLHDDLSRWGGEGGGEGKVMWW